MVAANSYDNFGGGSLCTILTGVEISGHTIGGIEKTLTLTAVPTPSDATTPTYSWSPTPGSGQGTTEAIYTFTIDNIGSYTVTLSASNGCSSQTYTDTHVVAVYDVTARGEICGLIDGVSDTGNVYCYKRHLVLREKLVSLFQATIDSVDVLRGFDMELRSVTQERVEFNAGLLRTYNFRIYGYFAWQDPSADPQHSATPSEYKTVSVIEAVVDALDSSDWLHTSAYHYDATKAQVEIIEPWLWCNELVHRATITLSVIDFEDQ